MVYDEEKLTLKGHEVLLRSAKDEDAQQMIDVLRQTCGETDFLLAYPDGINFTVEEEMAFIRRYNEGEKAGLLLAFVDGKYVGNTSFSVFGPEKYSHRGNLGIGILLKYTEMGLGTVMLKKELGKMKELGLEQAELDVFATNDRAIHVYGKLGFKKCGQIPNGVKMRNGTYTDLIHMVCPLNDAEY